MKKLTKKKKNSQDKKGKLIIATISLLMLGSFASSHSLNGPIIDPKTSCPLEPHKVVSIVIDISDRLRKDTYNHLIDQLNRDLELIETGSKIEFYVMNSSLGDKAIPIRLTDNTNYICRPSKKSSIAFIDELLRNPDYENGRFSNLIRTALDNNLAENKVGSDSSPIMNLLTNIGLKNQKTPIDLIIFSDFMELSDKINLYNSSGLELVRHVPISGMVKLRVYPVKDSYTKIRNEYISRLFPSQKLIDRTDLSGSSNTLAVIPGNFYHESKKL
jgi:hypothetical protein